MTPSAATTFPSGSRQRGVALAVSLIILVILTLLGFAALRATQTGLRIANNSESRAAAQQGAEAMVSLVLEDKSSTYLPDNYDASFKACSIFVATLPLVLAGGYNTVCATGVTATVASDHDPALDSYGYVLVRRVLPLFAESTAFRGADNSGRAIDYAHYLIVGGYDKTAASASASEIADDRLVPHIKDSLAGINLD